MAVAGALIGGALGSFGRKPEIPKLPAIDPNAVQSETINANADALPSLQQLGTKVNAYNQTQQLGMLSRALEFALPGGLSKAQSVVNSQLNGEVPNDVRNLLQRSAVAGAYGRGYGPQSGLASNDFLRNLGLTSLQMQGQGMAGFQQLAGMVPQTQAFNVSSMFYTPQQRLEFAFQERGAQFQRNLLNEQVKAAPDPATAALGREIDRFFNTAASVGMGAAGAGG